MLNRDFDQQIAEGLRETFVFQHSVLFGKGNFGQQFEDVLRETFIFEGGRAQSKKEYGARWVGLEEAKLIGSNSDFCKSKVILHAMHPRGVRRIVGRSANAAAPHVVTESLGRLLVLPCARHLLRRGRRKRKSRLGRLRKRHFVCHRRRSEAILEPFLGRLGASVGRLGAVLRGLFFQNKPNSFNF